MGLHRDREAEPALLEAYRITQPALGADNSGVQECAGLLATLYARAGRPGEAASWQARAKAAP